MNFINEKYRETTHLAIFTPFTITGSVGFAAAGKHRPFCGEVMELFLVS